MVYSEMGDYNLAKENLLIAASSAEYLTPENSYANLGLLEIKFKKYESALRYADKGLVFSKRFPTLHYVRGLALKQLGKLPEAFDAIVSNPPYVARADAAALAAEVRDFEPALALFAEPDDDLSSYRAIVAGLGARLRSGGWLAFEVGQGQAAGVAELLATAEFAAIETVHDLASIPRVVLGRSL